MRKTSPPLYILFFAARDLQRNYFDSLSHHLNCPSKVVWYKDIWLPGLQGLKFLRQANIAHIVDLKLREKQNAISSEAVTVRNNSVSWRVYAFIRRMGANYLFLKYIRYLLRNPSVIVAVWNGNKLRQAIVVEAAKCLNRRCAFFENGLLPNTTTLDFQGVNAFNSLPRHREFYDGLSFDEKTRLPSELVARAPEGKKEVTSTVTSRVAVKLPQRFIFVPFQVNTDSQITIHSPWIRNMDHLFEVISGAQKQMKDRDISFVFKEHPSSAQNYQYLHERVRNNEQLMFANDISTQELIEKADAVITINSTVGFEALLLGKKVIVLGDAFYGFYGLARHANNQDEILETLNGINDWQQDNRLRENFLRYIQEEYAVAESWTQPGNAHWSGMNNKFECKNSLGSHALFMVSTPLNLFMATAIALENRAKNEKRVNNAGVSNHTKCELCFIDQPGIAARVYVEVVKAWQESPFDKVHVLPFRASDLLKKLCNRRRAFRQLRNIIEELQPDMIAVGNDRRVEFQYAMHYSQSSGYNPRGAYMDDGTYTYVGRKTKGLQDSWIDNGIKKLVYGRWWQQPETVGASEWIDDAYLAFPDQAHKLLKQKSIHGVDAGLFESPAVQSLSQSLLKAFDVEGELLSQLNVVLTLPHASLVADGSGYIEIMQRLVEELCNRGQRIGVKYHPRESDLDPFGLANKAGVVLLPSVLAFEVLLPRLGNAVIVGDVSTTLLSTRWLRPALRVVAVASGNYQEQFLELFKTLDIEVVDDVSDLAGKLQD